MPEAMTLEGTIRELLCEAAQWRLIALLLECPGEGWLAQAGQLAGEADDARLREAVDAAREEASADLYHTVFGPGGPAAPREVSYRDAVLSGQMLDELSRYYQAFGYSPSLAEPPDHVAIEAGFLGYLRLKEAYARWTGDDERASTAAEAARRFSREHLAPMARSLSAAVDALGIRYLSLAAAALVKRCDALADSR